MATDDDKWRKVTHDVKGEIGWKLKQRKKEREREGLGGGGGIKVIKSEFKRSCKMMERFLGKNGIRIVIDRKEEN